MDAETSTRTSSIAHRSSSLLIGEQRRRSFVAVEDEKRMAGRPDSWSIKKLILGRNGSQKKYRSLERREPRRLRKKSLANTYSTGTTS